MIFQNLQVEVGDIVALRSTKVPLPEFQAAVIRVTDGVLEVLSTMLVPFRHNGDFAECDIERIEIVRSAAEAIPRESRGNSLAKDQRVSVVTGDGRSHQGMVIAAFDGIVVARSDAGELITGGASRFIAVV